MISTWEYQFWPRRSRGQYWYSQVDIISCRQQMFYYITSLNKRKQQQQKILGYGQGLVEIIEQFRSKERRQSHDTSVLILLPDAMSRDNTCYIAHICIFLLPGVGILMAILSFYFTWYTVVVLMWTFYYIVNSFFALVPWTTCDGWWNTLFCKGNTNGTFVALFTHIWGSGWGGGSGIHYSLNM